MVRIKYTHKITAETLKEREHLRDLSIDGMIILNVLKIGCEGMDWTRLVQNRVQLWDLVNTEMSIRVILKGGGIS
jgi:hypothetical protein